jgi:hypothetical protein
MTVGLLLPDAWGEQLLGGTWEGARELMLPMGVAIMAMGVTSGGLLGLRALGDARRSFRARIHITPWQVVCPLAGTLAAGATGFGFGFAAGNVATAVILWRAFDAALRERASSTGSVQESESLPPAGEPARGPVEESMLCRPSMTPITTERLVAAAPGWRCCGHGSPATCTGSSARWWMPALRSC